ncbi:MAG: GntR family transcriptional regulator [Pontibacterium sp.]
MTENTQKAEASVFELIRSDILNGTIEPGSKLSINNLTQSYKTSAAPVREALSRLDGEGLITRKGLRGYWAAPISKDEFIDVSRLRLMLEVDAFRQSIVHGDLGWEANIAGARHREMSIKKLAQESSEDMSAELNRENRLFHMALIANCPSAWQLKFISTLYDQSERFRRLSLNTLAKNGDTNKSSNKTDEHGAIVDAAFRYDAETACQLLHQHIERSNQLVLDTVFPE